MANSLDFRVKNGLVVATTATIQSSTNSTSTLTGALVVSGGAGIRGNLYVGGTIFGSLIGVATTATTATNIAGGIAGYIPIQSAGGVTSFISTGSVGQLLQMQAGNTATWVSTGSLVAGTAFTSSQIQTVLQTANATYYPTFVDSNNATATGELVYTTSSFTINPLTGVVIYTSTAGTASTNTGALQVVGGIGIGGGGYFGGIVTATNIFVGPWAVSTGTAVGVTVQSTASNATFFPVFVSVNTSTPTALPEYSTSSFTINPSTGAVNIGSTAISTSTNTGALTVAGGVGIGGNIVIGGNSTVTNSEVILGTTAATSTASGALQVRGGAGIGGSLYAGNIYSNGSQVIPLKIEEFTASASQTTFTVTGGYIVGTVMVFANGIFLNSGDFTASNGTTFVLNEARGVGDIIKVIAGGTSSAVNQSQSFSIAMSVAMSM